MDIPGPQQADDSGERAVAGRRKVGISRRTTRPGPRAEEVTAPAPETPDGELDLSIPAEFTAAPRPEAPPVAAWTPPRASSAADEPAVVYEGRFASYTQARLLRLEGVDGQQVADLDRVLVGLGFEHLGDLHTSRTAQAVFRVYSQRETSVYAILLKSGPRGGYEPELYTAFADGVSLTTSIACRSGLSQDRKRKTLRLGAEGGLDERYAAHLDKVWELSDEHGGTRPASSSLAGFAEALDDLLLRVRQ